MIQGTAIDPSVVTHIANGHALAPIPDALPNHTSDMVNVEIGKHQDQSGKRMKGIVDSLVYDYLIHHGYGGAARAFYAQTRRPTPDKGPGPRP